MKKKVAWNSNIPLVRTGLAKNTKYVLDYLYRTNKYDLTLYAMGMPFTHPAFQQLPYKVYGCLPDNQAEAQAFNQLDEGAKKSWAYGNGYIDRFLQTVKPDILICSDDIWSFNGYTEKSWYNKINTVFHITIDSLPILPQGIEMAKKNKNFLVWNKFAEKELHKLGHKHVQTIPGCINDKDFYRLPNNTRKDLRKRFNLPEDAFIVGSDSRNQLRKEWPALLEGFSMFIKENPKINAYLFLITTHNEGWSIPRYLEEFNIPREKFLALYVCKNCKNIQVRPLDKNDEQLPPENRGLDCKFCNNTKCQQTIRIDFGCSEEQLNEAYNLFDGFCHVFNAGGHELCLTQSLYCEIPLATVDYASGSYFCEQPFVHKINSAWSRDIGTEFKRSRPYPKSIADWFNKLYKMSESQRREIGRKGREWAISIFSPQVVGKQWETLIDSLPAIDYDFNFSYIPKNPNAVIPYIEDDREWLKRMYKDILNMEVTNEDEGLRNWMNNLEKYN